MERLGGEARHLRAGRIEDERSVGVARLADIEDELFALLPHVADRADDTGARRATIHPQPDHRVQRRSRQGEGRDRGPAAAAGPVTCRDHTDRHGTERADSAEGDEGAHDLSRQGLSVAVVRRRRRLLIDPVARIHDAGRNPDAR